MAPTCCARLLSDLSAQTECDKEATSSDGKFCAFHAWQCHALYVGYKRRNAALDALDPPPYLANKTTSVVVQDFNDIDDEATLRTLQRYLFRKYNLLDGVIRARKLHHRHFFAVDNDYGHERYLDRLQNERHNMVKALEKLGKRDAEVMYEQRLWLDWVRQCQQKEEEEAQSEANKVKLESLLFKRYQKELDARQRDMRSRENKKREEAYLDKAFNENRQMSREEEEKWDPIQDMHSYEKDKYIRLIKLFLVLNEQGHDENSAEDGASQLDSTADSKPADKSLTKSAKKKAKRANAQPKQLDDSTKEATGAKDFIEMETKNDMRKRLQTPFTFERTRGDYPCDPGLLGTTPVLSHEEIEPLLEVIYEIKNFLFCRLLLASSALLPIAIQADSIEEFLQREHVTREHVRDICLKLELPSLEDMRDACADFIRERDGADAPQDMAEDFVQMDIIGSTRKKARQQLPEPNFENCGPWTLVTHPERTNPSILMDTLRSALHRQQEYREQDPDLPRGTVEKHAIRLIVNDNCILDSRETCHMGDLEPGGLSRYMEHKSMVTAMDKFVMSDIDKGPFELCKFMQTAPLIREEHRVVEDAFRAYAAIALFYQAGEFLASEHGRAFKSSLLFDQGERAKRIPDRRTHRSNEYMPAEFWAEQDKLLRRYQPNKGELVSDLYPMEWRKAIRSVVIRLFKAGIIQSAYTPNIVSRATAAAEPNRPLDLYLDFRSQANLKSIVPLVDPTPFDRDYIVEAAKKFAAQYASGKFSALRIWSAPHFYPMRAREGETFAGDRGRYWEWQFIPKDMPRSEWSIHKSMSMVIDRSRHIWGNQVIVARDLFLVMGKDADECRRLSEGVTWTVQSSDVQPFEIDFWRSFVNVDANFLEGLHPV